MKKYKPDNPMRCRMVFFEGLDKAGKSLLCRRARFESGHEVLMFDRGFVGRKVFQKFRHEDEFPIKDWNFLEKLLNQFRAYAVVFLDIPAKTSFNRQIAVEGKSEFTLKDLEDQRELYLAEIQLLEDVGVPILRIDTSTETEDESTRRILTWIKGGAEWI